MACKFEYNGKWYTENELEKVYNATTIQVGDIIEFDGVEYEVKDSNRIGSQLLSGEQALALSEDNIYDETASILDTIPIYNLEPTGKGSVEIGGVSPLFNVPLTELQNRGAIKVGENKKSKEIEDDLAFQIKGTEGSKASPKTIAKVNEFLKRIGVEVKDLDTSRYNGINGVAKLLEQVIEMAQGAEQIALPEEAMHFAVEILKQTNSPLYKQMINKVGSYTLYKEVLNTYGKKKSYQIDGKPDIIKLKEETIGKILAEYFIKSEEQATEKPQLLEQTKGWIEQLKSWIQKWLNIAEFNPFEETVKQVKAGKVGEPVLQSGYTRLYRAETRATKEDGKIPDWLKEQPEYKDIQEATGRWFYKTREDAESHISKLDGTHITYVDIPTSDVEKYNARDNRFSGGYGREGREYFIPKTLANTRKDLNPTSLAKKTFEKINLDKLPAIYREVYKAEAAKGNYSQIMSEIKQQLSAPNSYNLALSSLLNGNVELANEIINSDFLSVRQNKAVDDLYNKYLEEDKNLVLVNHNSGDRHYTYKGEKVAQSVTEKISKGEETKWGEQTPEQIQYTKDTGVWGTAGHDYIQKYTEANLIDENGYARATPLNNKVDSPLAPALQAKLDAYMTSLIASYPEGTRFLLEKKVINKKDKGMTASTVDFKAIIPGENNTISKVDTLDWKFVAVKQGDIGWYKKEKWSKQMSEYVIMDKQYGLKYDQIGKSRMIPFVTSYDLVDKKDPSKGRILRTLKVGNIDPSKEDELFMLPVPSEEESTGFKKVDELVTRLKDQYKKLWDKRVEEKDKGAKNEKLNELSAAIRKLQLQINFEPLQFEAKNFFKGAKQSLDKYLDIDFSKFSKKEINDVLQELLELEASANVYADLSETFQSTLLGKTKTEDEIKKGKELDVLTQSSERLIENIRNTQIRAAAGLAVQENLLFTDNVEKAQELLQRPEKEIGMLAATFDEASKLSSKVTQLASKLWLNKKSQQYQEEKALAHEFSNLLPAFFAATSHLKNAIDAIKQKGKHKLIYKIDPKFYDEIKSAFENKDKKFLLANLNLDAYNAAIKEKLEIGIENIKNSEYSAIDDVNESIKDRKIQELKDHLQIDSQEFSGWNNKTFQYFYKQNAKIEDHISQEYKDMAKNPAVLKVWEFFTKLNEIGTEIGYTNSKAFLPFIEGTILEQMRQSSDVTKTAKELLKQGYVLNVNEKASHVRINKQTGEVEKSIARLFTQPSKNLSDTAYSQDITKIVGPWISAMMSYKTATEMESIMLTLVEVEANKGHLQIDPSTNKVIFDKDVPKEFEGNVKNTGILQKIVDDNIYHIQENSNTSIDIATDKLSKGDEEQKTTTKLQTKKIIDRSNRWIAMLATGGKLMVSIPNFVGEQFQATINSGTFYTWPEYIKNSIGITSSGGKSLSLKDKGLIDLIHPLNEDTQLDATRSFAAKQSPLKWLSTWSINDIMHSANRFGGLVSEYANAKTFNDNSMVEDGKIVNIRQYVSKQDAGKYSKMTQEERKSLEKTFESRVKALKETRSISKISDFNKEGMMEIPGVSPEELARYRTTVAEYARNISGKMSRDNKAEWGRSAILRSFMMFKGWIPKQVKLRTGDVHYNNELESWEYGRTRLFVKTITHLGLSRVLEMKEIIKGTDRGLEIMREILEEKKQKFYEATGQELEITEEEFFDMMRKELHSQSKELTMLLGIVSLFIASRAAKPDDGDDLLAQNRYKWWRKLINKISSELAFYYSPASADSITRGSILPSLSILNKVQKLLVALEEETRGYVLGDEELVDKSHPLKYFLNLVPGAAQFQNEILPIIAPDIATEQGIRVTEEARQQN